MRHPPASAETSANGGSPVDAEKKTVAAATRGFRAFRVTKPSRRAPIPREPGCSLHSHNWNAVRPPRKIAALADHLSRSGDSDHREQQADRRAGRRGDDEGELDRDERDERGHQRQEEDPSDQDEYCHRAGAKHECCIKKASASRDRHLSRDALRAMSGKRPVARLPRRARPGPPSRAGRKAPASPAPSRSATCRRPGRRRGTCSRSSGS